MNGARMDPLPVVAIVGRPNVGKSSLFNRLIGERRAIVDDLPGTTRDRVYGQVEWAGRAWLLVDTAGLQHATGELDLTIQQQLNEVAGAADAILVVVDATTMITSEDRAAAKLALKTGRPTILAVNKIDTAASRHPAEFQQLGIKQLIATSASQRTGLGDLLDALTAVIKAAPIAETAESLIRIALLGRPNVGKSSLFNALIGKPTALVAPEGGTTRDINLAEISYEGQTFQLADTAGVRRSGKIARGVEHFSVLRTLQSIKESDIGVVVMDATEPAVAGDQHIAGLVSAAGKGLILVVNKCDLAEDLGWLTRAIQRRFQFAWWAPLVLTSALSGSNVVKIPELAAGIAAARRQQIATGELNRLLLRLITKQAPTATRGRPPKLRYITQAGQQPPAFKLFGPQANLTHFSYRRYLEKGLRKQYDFGGTPIKLEFIPKDTRE